MNNIITAALLIFVTTGVFAQGYGKSYPGNGPYNNGRHDNGRYDTRLPNGDRQEALMINDLQREARGRIADGIARGTLTSQEAIRLLNEYERINVKERRSLSNGRLTNRETREITRDLENLIRGIRYEKMDPQRERDRMAQRRY
ncbi:MAG: hypothetical protein KKG00_11645 [Bacteroidetes bacterium]|nr:hypothetical protein [Bacteroidota bacterium]